MSTTVAFIEPKATAVNSTPHLAVAAQSVTGQHNQRLFVSPSGVVYELVNVSPQMAEKWLEANVGNRSLRPDAADKIRRDMVANLFQENGDSIRFSQDGVLLDGQHRLAALAAATSPAWLLVVSNLPDSVRDTIDDGSKRTMADRFAFRGETEPKTLASVVRRALLWERGMTVGTVKWQPSAMEFFEFFAAHPELVEATNAACHYRKSKLLRSSTVGLCWWLFSQLDADQCETFFDRLDDGADMKAKHPVLALRNRLIGARSEKSRLTEAYVMALVIKAWNAFREDREVIVLRFADHEAFPQPK